VSKVLIQLYHNWTKENFLHKFDAAF